MRLKEICFLKIPTVRGFEPNPKSRIGLQYTSIRSRFDFLQENFTLSVPILQRF